MENLIIVFGFFILVNYLYKKIKNKFKRSVKKPAKKVETKHNKDSEREQAIHRLMQNLEKAKSDRSEIVRDNPKLAAAVLKMWTKQK